jgi:hypothetical protein
VAASRIDRWWHLPLPVVVAGYGMNDADIEIAGPLRGARLRSPGPPLR